MKVKRIFVRRRRSPLAHPLMVVLAVIGAAFAVYFGLALLSEPAMAQAFTLDLGEQGGDTTGRIIQMLLLITVLSVAPSILIMMTSFVRIIVVLSFLRTAMGTQQTPPNQVLVGLALFMTLFIMMPTFEKAWDTGINPVIEGTLDEMEGFQRAIIPLRDFMMTHVRERDLLLFTEIARLPDEEVRENMPMRILIPAYLISELTRAFEIGFLLFVPFLIIDRVVASVLMAMGMMMLPPVIIALPFKIIFFVLVDGWYMTVGSLVKSFGAG